MLKLNFPRVFKQRDTFNLFIPWSQDHAFEFVFNIKKRILAKGHAFIPYCDCFQRPVELDDEFISEIRKQLSKNTLTTLVVAGHHSIHFFKVASLKNKVKENAKLAEAKAHKYAFWLEVVDHYVYRVNHGSSEERFEEIISQIIAGKVDFATFFRPFYIFNLDGVEKNWIYNRWVETGREYGLGFHTQELEFEEDVFGSLWCEFDPISRYLLTCSSLTRKEALELPQEERFDKLKFAFNLYVSALLCELEMLFIYPVVNLLKNNEDFAKLWEEMRDQIGSDPLYLLFHEYYHTKKLQLPTLVQFEKLSNSGKSLFFSLSSKMEKRVGSPNTIEAENFLKEREVLMDAYKASGLKGKIHGLHQLIESFSLVKELSSAEYRNINLKLNSILVSLTGKGALENIFFDLLHFKSSKKYVFKSFNEEVEDLLLALKKSA